MKAIDLPKNTVALRWRHEPTLSTANTSSFNNLVSGSYTLSTTTASSSDVGDRMANEIQRRLDQIYKEREEKLMRINGTEFKDLEKNLRKLGIELITIRHSTGDVGCEIEGYFNPEEYVKYCKHESNLEGFKTPKIKKDGKWLDLVPEKVKFSGPATIIFWKDGTKTVVKCQEDEYFDEEKGIAMCYLKKLFGNQGNYNNIFRKAMKVAEVQCKKEDLNATKNISISEINAEINDLMKDAAGALDKVLGGKK